MKRVAPEGTLTVLASEDPDAANSLDQPMRIVPHRRTIQGLGREFTFQVLAYSVSVLEFDAQ